MKNRFLNKYMIGLIVAILIVLFYFTYFKKNNTVLISNLFERPLNDTILNMSTLKIAGPVTILKHCDTPLLIDGINDSLHLYLSSYSDEGFKTWDAPNTSILIKKAKSDSFYLLRKKQMIGFRLIDRSYLVK